MTSRSATSTLLLTLASMAMTSAAQNPAPAVAAQATKPSPFWASGNLKLRQLGPAVFSGRIDSLAVVEDHPDTFYVGTATGGLWKTSNGGSTFFPLFDRENNLSIGDVAVSASNPSIVWVGSGEPNNRQSSTWGNGIYKSTDDGATWSHLGLDDTQAIGRIAIHPRDPDTVYVAALGHLFGPNAERGLFKTSDGGKTWLKVLFIDNDTGVVDVALDPQSPNIVYAAAYERRRTPWGFNGGGPGSAIYKSTDAGATWKKLTNGLPADGNTGRIGLAIFRKNPEIVYAVVENRAGGVFRSEDRGETWKRMNNGNMGSPYFSQIRIDPDNDLRIWVMLDNAYYSADGGKTFTPDLTVLVHSDFHAFWIDPANSNHIIAGSDGGVWTSQDRGHTWALLASLPIGQAYQVAVDGQVPYHVCAGFQDNGSWCGPSRTRSTEGIANYDWRRVITADGFYTVPDPNDANLIYSDAQEGQLVRLNWQTHEWAPIQPLPKAGEPAFRFQWNAPLIASAHHPGVLYYGANVLLKSADHGDTWSEISGDLTTAVDRNKLPILGKLPNEQTVSLNYGVTWFPSISVISESPVDERVLWVGTEDGNLQVTRDGGKSWKNVAGKVPGLPKGTWVTSITASRTAAGSAYASFDGHRSDDFHAYVFRTNDFGDTWHSLAAGIPAGSGPVRVVRENPNAPALLVLGAEFGAFLSLDEGKSWAALGMGLPHVPVNDIAFQAREHDLVLGTHGRSLWVLDDLRPLEELSRHAAGSTPALFAPAKAIAYRQYIESNGYNGGSAYYAANPPEGALITYFLPEQTKAKPNITITSGNGELVRELQGTAEAGLNRINWDLRYSTPAKPADIQLWAIQQGFFIYRVLPNLGMPAPVVAPGEYVVTLEANGSKSSQTLTVADDPSVTIAAEDRDAHRKLLMQAFHLYGEAIDTQHKLMSLETAVATTTGNWKKQSAKVPQPVQNAADALVKDSDDLHELLIGPKRRSLPSMNPPSTLVPLIARLLYSLEAYTAAPSSLQREQFEQYSRSLADLTARTQQLVTVRLAELNKSMRDAGMAFIEISAAANTGNAPPQ